jgi:hypothetical protein
MGRPKKVTDKQWLNQEPPQSEIELSPFGGYHIPIDKLRSLLDRVNGTTRNYKSNLFKDGYATQTAFGSIELTVWIDGNERTVTGAYNLPVQDAINGFWNGSLKSECIKNAAIELGARFGRNINKDAPKTDTSPVPAKTVEKLKAKPDEMVMRQYLSAVERNDEASIILLQNIYEIKTDANVE